MFELKSTTECELTKFVGRTQKGGKEDVPAVSFYLKIASASNTMLDMLSPTMRLMAYAPVEGQDQLPGVEQVTPILRSTDLKHWKSETVHEGWKLFVSRGIGDDEGLQMGSCKVDEFTFDLYQGGHVDCEFRVSTADLDEAGAGMLWGRQKRKVFVQVHAPELPAPAIDGSVEAFKRDHPDAMDATDLFSAGAGAEPRSDGDDPDGDGSDPDAAADDQPAEAERGENWPFGTGGDTSTGPGDDAAFEAGAAQAVAEAGLQPKGRRARRAAVGAVE